MQADGQRHKLSHRPHVAQTRAESRPPTPEFWGITEVTAPAAQVSPGRGAAVAPLSEGQFVHLTETRRPGSSEQASVLTETLDRLVGVTGFLLAYLVAFPFRLCSFTSCAHTTNPSTHRSQNTNRKHPPPRQDTPDKVGELPCTSQENKPSPWLFSLFPSEKGAQTEPRAVPRACDSFQGLGRMRKEVWGQV